MFHSWPVTHDRALKSLFITYAKVQLELARAIPEILEKLLDVIIKELDQNFNTGAGLVWCEAPRDEKAGSLRCFQEELMDLSATALYLAYKCTPRTSHNKKKLKTEHVMTAIMDSLLRGSLVWYAPSIHFKRRHCLSLKSHMRILTTLGLLKPEVNSRNSRISFIKHASSCAFSMPFTCCFQFSSILIL
jgi:hypothetical protein